MLQTTIGAIAHDDWSTIDSQGIPYRLYLVRHNDTIFYIGQSVNPFERLYSHIGLDRRAEPSELGKCIIGNAPDSHQWTVELYTRDEGKAFIFKYRETLPEDMQRFHRTYDPDCKLYDVSMAEEAMIALYHPCLNVTYNNNPAPLPEEYSAYLNDVRPGTSSTQFLKI